jgi:DamX protein
MEAHNDIADINVTSRIDYTLRFTKQAVLVVGEQTEDYSQVAREYLIALSNQESAQINTAFISASSKLNNIQIRCRLIEQLFTNTLFDPEQSLALSVLRLAQQQSDVISIIIEHAQSLSLQIKYELCQLVLAAKKADITINVVLFGSFKSGHEVTGNKTLFKNKLAVIDGISGKLYSYDDPKLAQTITPVKIHLWKKVFLVTAVLLLLSISAMLFIYISVSEKPTTSQFNTRELDKMATQFSTDVASIFAAEPSEQRNIELPNNQYNAGNNKTLFVPNSDIKKVASYSDINNVLLNVTELNAKKEAATSAEVLNALLSNEQIKIDKKTSSEYISSNEISSNEITSKENSNEYSLSIAARPATRDINKLTTSMGNTEKKNATISAMDSSKYYRKASLINKKGYVIQVAGYFESKLLADLIITYPDLELYHYTKSLQGKLFYVVTSKNYSTKIDAKAAMALLPETLRVRQPWIKSISSVLDEMNTFKP